MNLIRYEPKAMNFPLFREMEEMSDRLNRLFGTWTRPLGTKDEPLTVSDWTPSVDIQETENEYLVKAELPEIKREDVKVTVENGVLTLQGERKQEKEEKGKKFHRIERSYGSFVRSFRLPDDVDESAVKAEFKDGMLNVTLPKSAQAKTKSTNVAVT